jgi:hypothetical protein
LSSFSLPRLNRNLPPPTIWGRQLTWSQFIGILVILSLAIFPPLLGWGGRDFIRYYREATLTGNYNVRTWNPYPAYWFIYPFAILPQTIGLLLWNLFSAGSFIYALRRFNGRYLNFALSLPCFWTFYTGQIEGVLTLGAALSFSANPYLVGLGLTLLSFKPQIGLFPILFVLLHRRDWRIYLMPALVYGLSLLYWGWWIPEWLDALFRPHLGYTNISLFPYSLLLLPLLLYAFSSYKVWLAIGSLVPPYFAVYSLAVLFAVETPWWAALASWALYLLAFYWPYQAPGYLIPLAILALAIWQIAKAKREPTPQTAV